MPRFSAENKELIAAAVRDRAYESACALIREDGWRLFTMGKLADRVGVAKGTLYNYFRDKDDVVQFIMENKSLQIAEEMRACAEHHSDTLELLREMVKTVLACFKEFRFLRFAVSEVIQKRYGEDVSLSRLPIVCIQDVLTDVIRRGVEEKVLRPCEPTLAASILHAMMMGIGMGSDIDERLDIGRPEIMQAVCESLLMGLIRERKE